MSFSRIFMHLLRPINGLMRLSEGIRLILKERILPCRFYDRRVHRGHPDDPIRHHHFCGAQTGVVRIPYPDARQVPHHRSDSAGGGRARGAAPGRHPRASLFRQGEFSKYYCYEI